MGTLSGTELILCSIATVFTSSHGPARATISEKTLQGLLKPPLNIVDDPMRGLLINSTRDQIEVTLTTGKVDVRDLSGDLNHASNRISAVVHEFMDCLSDYELVSYGINFIVKFTGADSKEILLRQMLSPEIVERLGRGVSSNSINLVLEGQPKVLTLKFDLRSNTDVNINFNASENTATLPRAADLTGDIQAQYNQLLGILGQLME